MSYINFTDNIKTETEILYKMYGKAIKKKAMSMLDDSHLAEDCMQSVMLRLAANLEKLGEYGSPRAKAYIITATEHTAIDIIRKRQKELPMGLHEEERIKSAYHDDGPEIKGKYGFSEELDEYLEPLNDEDRKILYLRYAVGKTDKEIGRLLNKEANTISQKISRSRKKLRDLMKGEGEKRGAKL